jgi:CheY-like chemotaxis protein
MTRILVVDDEIDTLNLLRTILEISGYEPYTTLNSVDAIILAEVEHPDCILLDIMMPQLDGFTLCKMMRLHPATANLPIVFVTAYSSLDLEDRRKEAGADMVLPKPIGMNALVEAIEKAMALRSKSPAISSAYDQSSTATPAAGTSTAPPVISVVASTVPSEARTPEITITPVVPSVTPTTQNARPVNPETPAVPAVPAVPTVPTVPANAAPVAASVVTSEQLPVKPLDAPKEPDAADAAKALDSAPSSPQGETSATPTTPKVEDQPAEAAPAASAAAIPAASTTPTTPAASGTSEKSVE